MGATIQNSLLKGYFLLVIFVCHNSQAQFHHGLELGMNMTNADFMIGESAEPSNSFGFLIGYRPTPMKLALHPSLRNQIEFTSSASTCPLHSRGTRSGRKLPLHLVPRSLRPPQHRQAAAANSIFSAVLCFRLRWASLWCRNHEAHPRRKH